MDDVIKRQLHAFAFKWQRYLKLTETGQPNEVHRIHVTNHWREFIDMHKSKLDNMIRHLLSPTYTKNREPIVLTHSVNVPAVDVAVCEYLCYPDDKVILIQGVIDNALQQKMYVVVTTHGSLITKTNACIKMIKFGTICYNDEIIKIIQSIKCYNSLEDWMEILGELDNIQMSITLRAQIKH